MAAGTDYQLSRYEAVRVETLSLVASQINHATASTGRGSAEISQAERLTGKVSGDSGVNPPAATGLRTLQEISSDES